MLAPEDRDLLGLPVENRPMRRASAVSQVLRAIRDDVERGTAKWEFAPEGREDAGYRVLVASDRATRERAYALAQRMYRGCGYTDAEGERLCVSPFDADPQTMTLLIEDMAGQDVATVTLTFDSAAGLPSDEIYHPELDVLRAQGRRLVEVTRLAMEESHAQSKTLLVCLFNFIYVYAERVRGFTDFVVEVNPRHVPFYRRLLLFETIGPERPCPRVQGAPAVLLRLDLSIPEHESQRVRADGPMANERTLYPYFYSWLEEGAIAEFLCRRHRPMTEEDKRHFHLLPALQRTRPALAVAVEGT